MATIVRGIQPDEIESFWPEVEGLVLRAIARAGGRFGTGDVKQSLIAGRRQLWLTWPDRQCLGITEISDYPLQRRLTLFALAGRLPEDWREVLRRLEAWGAAMGCKAIEFNGRKGWPRRLPDYRKGLIEMSKEIGR